MGRTQALLSLALGEAENAKSAPLGIPNCKPALECVWGWNPLYKCGLKTPKPRVSKTMNAIF